MINKENEYLKSKPAAAYLKVSLSSLEKGRKSGNGPPYVKLQKSVVYRRCDLDRWMEKQLVGTV
ncbi:MAG: helix-turn-helix domain-containing protein [Magnetococcales bacterium]|nr:helix-turn-helix domain-containing protein [Magnetococcales bacterium]MBF0419616.1 helix-turn-helix domain-containing protein [Magnetococcales bacterium]